MIWFGSCLQPCFQLRYVPTLLLWLLHLFIIFLDDPHTLPTISCLLGNVFVDAGSQAAISAVATVLPKGNVVIK